MRLNIGCGKDIREDMVNCDQYPAEDVDFVFDLSEPWPFFSNSVDHIHASHVIEHVGDPLPMMEEAWRCARDGATMRIVTVYGSTDAAWSDPDHRREFYPESFLYFGQPMYHLADYGYVGDWRVDNIELHIFAAVWDEEGGDIDAISRRVHHDRNIVYEIVANMVAIKPARPQQLPTDGLTIYMGRVNLGTETPEE